VSNYVVTIKQRAVPMVAFKRRKKPKGTNGPLVRSKFSRPSVAERADQIMTIVEQLGGTTNWPTIREKLGLPSESMLGLAEVVRNF
jgi:hypothetical protein